jgi:hypothetical protein
MNENSLVVVKEFQAIDRLAFKQGEAAKQLGLSRNSLVHEIQRRKIFPMKTYKLISKEELIRYCQEETQLTRRSRRTVRTTRLAYDTRHNTNTANQNHALNSVAH